MTDTPDNLDAYFDSLSTNDLEAMLSESPADKRDSDELVDEAESRGDVSRRKAEAMRITFHQHKCTQIAAFSEVGLPAPGEIITAITTGSFNAYTIVLYALQQFHHLDHLSITSFNMHQNVITDLFHLYDAEQIRNLDIMLSESVKFRMPKRFNQLLDLFAERQPSNRLRVKFNWNHSKIILIKAAGHNYCITGSGNLSDNAQFEQYHLSCDLDEFHFFAAWIHREFQGENRKRERIL